MPRALAAIAILAAIAAAFFFSADRKADAACSARRFEGDAFIVCAYDDARDALKIALEDANGAPLRRLSALRRALGPAANDVRFAMNAGMYDPAGSPVGLYVEAGRERRALDLSDGPGNFHLKPNGVFLVEASGRAAVVTSAAYAASKPAPQWATQSGPMLVVDGALNPALQVDGPSRHVRNGVGVCAGGTFFVISRGVVSFGKFARFFRDELGCTNALYLDGYVSSLWAPRMGRLDDRFDLGPMIFVSRVRRVAASSRSD